MRKIKYFKKGDFVIYIILLIIFSFLTLKTFSFKNYSFSKAEIYVNDKLKYVYPLTKEEKKFFVPTDIGGVNIIIKDRKIRVTTSNSPLKLDVKQGWINSPGQVIIGIPDRLLIKIVGDEEKENQDIDFIIK